MGTYISFYSAAPAKRASLPQHAGKAAAKASESSSSEESSEEEEEEDKKKKPVQVCSLGCKEGSEMKLNGASSLAGWVVEAALYCIILGAYGDAEV